ncbi:uncharacterized protein LOC111025999 [Momordica charantia]|uniref:Uncharacterized protein LOC111025999 n=1 Tax=Momordica charantia TaxID=3673 RepID=A0A6J1DZC9_MOMCH|nr:uncharacterized protein LOC111025999 [Momordica charantia]
MMLVSVVAELLEEYTVLLAEVLRQLFNSAPFPRRVRFLILHNLPSGNNSNSSAPLNRMGESA